MFASLRSVVDDETIVVVNPELRAAVDEIVKELDARLGSQTKDIDKRLEDFQTLAESRMKVHFERMEGLVTRAAEGFDATLGSIDRRLDRLERKVDNNLRDHGLILKDHANRISRIENS